MFKKIWNWLLGKPQTEKTATHDNMVDAKKELRDAIVTFFSKNFFGQKTFTDTVVIWISNNQSKQSYVRDKKFENELRVELENRQLKAISKAEFVFKTENPPLKLELAKIAEDVYIQLVAASIKTPEEISTQAKITIVKGKGSLMKNKYILDAKKQTEYNIGSNLVKNNHIVINYNDLQHPENQNVSRQHAKIVFVAGKGFHLQSRNENNRTIINRNNQRIADLTDLNKKKLLYNNDEIELGKSVCLKFEIVAETDMREK